jgi:hypothetical protein
MDQQQLDLPGVKKRARKAPPPKEFHLHRQLAELLRKFVNPAWKYTHLPMGEERDKRAARKLWLMGLTPGWPDLVFAGPGACVFWLELKRKRSGRLSDEQLAMRSHLMRCGFPYLVTSDLQDAINALQDFGILPKGIRVQ